MMSALIESSLLLTTVIDYITSLLVRINYKIAEIQSGISNASDKDIHKFSQFFHTKNENYVKGDLSSTSTGELVKGITILFSYNV